MIRSIILGIKQKLKMFNEEDTNLVWTASNSIKAYQYLQSKNYKLPKYF